MDDLGQDMFQPELPERHRPVGPVEDDVLLLASAQTQHDRRIAQQPVASKRLGQGSRAPFVVVFVRMQGRRRQNPQVGQIGQDPHSGGAPARNSSASMIVRMPRGCPNSSTRISTFEASKSGSRSRKAVSAEAVRT